jgi:hypothetical protein
VRPRPARTSTAARELTNHHTNARARRYGGSLANAGRLCPLRQPFASDANGAELEIYTRVEIVRLTIEPKEAAETLAVAIRELRTQPVP